MKPKIPVGILGATGVVGQKFIQFLQGHPWFEISALVASERSAGKTYAEACNWTLDGDPPQEVLDMQVLGLNDEVPASLVFSALPANIAGEVEERLVKEGVMVCSNANAFRQDEDVPVVIPEVNGEHIRLAELQAEKRGWKGMLVTSPNCTTTGIVMALKPLQAAFGLKRFFATSMQAVSGAGYPGLSFMDMADNVVPFIKGEEQKMQTECCLLLGEYADQRVRPADIRISAQANRVPVQHGHTVCLSAEFERKPSAAEAIEALKSWRGPILARDLPSAPPQPLVVCNQPDRPQPRRDREAYEGMVTSVGRVRPCEIFDLKLVSVVHNAVRGAAGGAILNAELLCKAGYL